MNRIRTIFLFVPLLASTFLGPVAFGQEDDRSRRDERRVLKASEFSREELSEEYRRMARQKRHQEMDFAKELLSSGRMTGETKAEMMLRLADLYFEEGRDLYLSEMQDFEKKFDGCFNDPKCDATTLEPDNGVSQKWQQKSIKLYRQILRNYATFGRADEATFYLASALQEVGSRKEGIKEFTRLAKTYPDSQYVPDAYVQIGEYYFDNNNAYKALLAYQKAAAYRNSSKYGFAMYKLGWCYYNVGEYGKGIETMKTVVAYSMSTQDENNKSAITLQEEALKDLVRFFADAGEMDEAYSYFNKLGKKELIRSMLKRLATTYFEQGKFEQTIQTYRRLIAEEPASPDSPDYQNEIIQAYSKMGRKRETVTEIDKLRRDYGPSSDWARQNAANQDALSASVAFIEKNLRTVATNYHDEARKLRTGRSAKEAYALAMKAYADYLEAFPDSKYTYDMRYAYGELLYKIKRYDESYDQYMQVVKMDKKGKHSRFCAESAIFAADEMVKKEGASRAKSGSTEAVELTAWEQKLLTALDQFSEMFPTDPKTRKIIYKSAYLLYNKNHFKEASDRFRVVIGMDPRSKEAEQAAHQILDSFTLVEDWKNLREVSKAFRDQEGLGSSKFKGEVANIYMRASFKLVQVNYEDKEDWKGAADGFWAFYQEFPDSNVADKALNNASVYFHKTDQRERTIEVRRELIAKFPKSEFYNGQVALLGFDMENIARFEEAADWYEKLFKLDKKHDSAPAAIYSAAKFREALGDWEASISNYKQYMATFPDREGASQVVLDIARIYESKAKWSEAAQVYYAFFTQRDTSALAADELMFARLHHGLALLEQNKRRQAIDHFEKSLEWFQSEREKETVFDVGVDFAAQMMFFLAEDEFNEFTALTIGGPSGKVSKKAEDKFVKAAFTAKQDGRASIEAAYVAIIETGAGEWSVNALVQLGRVYENMASSLRNSHVPSYLDNERQIDFYKAAMNDNAIQLDDRALTYYTQALTKAYEINLYNESTAYANERRSEILPDDYPALVEDLLTPRYSSAAKTTAGFETLYEGN